ncbi:MAG: AAA family ATPase, partial [Pseudobdellovibrionaceae bacterium]
LREYESEYHYLFHTVLKYARDPNAHEGWVMLIPNAMRKVLDVFLAFKFPGSSGFAGKIEQALSTVPEADSHRVRAIERLVQSESHADNLDDLLTFSKRTIEETEAASKAVLELLKMMDEGHYAQLAKICA